MNRILPIIQGAALVLPGALVLGLILHYAVNVPNADQWVLVDIVGRLRAGVPLWSELFSQHNEHRHLFPKLIMLGLAYLTRWNVLAEMLASVLITAGTLAIVMRLARPVLADAGSALRLWVSFVFSALLFSLSQWQNWLWGWQLAWFLSIFAAVAAIALALRSLAAASPWIWIAAAAAMVVLSQFSIANGMALWIAIALILAFHRRRITVLAVWLGCALAVSAGYLSGYHRPPHHPTLLAGIDRPFDLVLYVMGYLSGPLGPSFLIGAGCVVSFLVLSAMAFRRHAREPHLVIPWVAMGAFACASALVTGIGRVGFGPNQGLESRYSTVALLLSIALVPLGVLIARDTLPRSRWRLFGIAAALSLTILLIIADIRALGRMTRFSQDLARGRDCLLAIDQADDACLERLYPEPAVVRRLAVPLRSFGWSSFASSVHPVTPEIRLIYPGESRAFRVEMYGGTFGWIEAARFDGAKVSLAGWARHPRGRPARVVVALDDGTVVGQVDASLERPDVAAYFGDRRAAPAGWRIERPPPSSSPPWRLRAYLLIDESILVPIGEEQVIAGDAASQPDRR